MMSLVRDEDLYSKVVSGELSIHKAIGLASRGTEGEGHCHCDNGRRKAQIRVISEKEALSELHKITQIQPAGVSAKKRGKRRFPRKGR